MGAIFNEVFKFMNSIHIPVLGTNFRITPIAIMICIAINILVLKVFVAFFKK